MDRYLLRTAGRWCPGGPPGRIRSVDRIAEGQGGHEGARERIPNSVVKGEKLAEHPRRGPIAAHPRARV